MAGGDRQTDKMPISNGIIDTTTMSREDIGLLINFIKTAVLIKHKQMTTEQAIRVREFEFELTEDGKQLSCLEYWLGNGRRKTNYRKIDLSADSEFDELFYTGVHRHMCPPPSQSNAPSMD
jgi:hypothetical protein